MSGGEYSEPWREWQQAAPSSGPVLWLSAVIVTGDMMGVTVTPDLNTHGVAQCPVLQCLARTVWRCADGGEKETRHRGLGSGLSRRWSLQGTAVWPGEQLTCLGGQQPSSAQHQPAAAECFDPCSSSSQCRDVQRCVQSDVMSVQWPLQSGRKFSLRNQEFRMTPQ